MKQDNHIDVLHPTKNPSLLSRMVRLLARPSLIPGVIRNRLGKPRTIEWESRADELGAYAVIDTRHSPAEYEYVTKRQKEILYPLLKGQLRGNERTVLDFGCGPGRFTGDLADITMGRVIGSDVSARLIEIAPSHQHVEYVHSKKFFDENVLSFDVIWICLVLGGIPNNELPALAIKITNALKRDGLLFLVESSGHKPVDGIWRIRTTKQIMSLFPAVQLRSIGSYYDANQEISILTGRRNGVAQE